MITSKDIRELEDSCGIPKLQLMENAGRGIFKTIKEKFPNIKNKRILIIAYHGNNGGDGFVAARLLAEEAETDILFIGEESKFKEEARINYARIENNNKIQLFLETESINFDDYDIILDAMLGTGTKGEVKEPISSTIDLINDSKAFKISIDIPTGLNPDTGETSDKAINADLIITFHDIKKGLNTLKDKTTIIDIGIKRGD